MIVGARVDVGAGALVAGSVEIAVGSTAGVASTEGVGIGGIVGVAVAVPDDPARLTKLCATHPAPHAIPPRITMATTNIKTLVRLNFIISPQAPSTHPPIRRLADSLTR